MDANQWRGECNYIDRVMVRLGRVKEMNHSPSIFLRYCRMQAAAATREGFHDVNTHIQHVIDDLESQGVQA